MTDDAKARLGEAIARVEHDFPALREAKYYESLAIVVEAARQSLAAEDGLSEHDKRVRELGEMAVAFQDKIAKDTRNDE
jgi:hypothetical protein